MEKTILKNTTLVLMLGLMSGACLNDDETGSSFEEETETGELEETGDGGWDDGGENSGDGGDGDHGDGDHDDGDHDDGNSSDDGADDDDDGNDDAAAACGDGMLDEERGEECDDGNLDELDGCLSTCRVGPTGLYVDYTVSSPLDVRGGAAGNEFDQECPEGEVIIGMLGRADTLMHQLQVRCGAIELTSPEPGSLSVSLEEGTMLDAIGGAGGSAFSLGCEEGHAVVGFSGHAGAFMERLAMTCAPVTLVYHPQTGEPSIGFGEVVHTGMVGSAGAPTFSSDCPAGQVATSIRGRSEASINALGMACRPLVLL